MVLLESASDKVFLVLTDCFFSERSEGYLFDFVDPFSISSCGINSDFKLGYLLHEYSGTDVEYAIYR